MADFEPSSTNELFDSFLDSAQPVLEEFAETAARELTQEAIRSTRDFFDGESVDEAVVVDEGGTISFPRRRIDALAPGDASRGGESSSSLLGGLNPGILLIGGIAAALFFVTR